jgi:hypothetical protein
LGLGGGAGAFAFGRKWDWGETLICDWRCPFRGIGGKDLWLFP